MGQVGFTVVGGAAVGFGLGYALDLLVASRVGRIVGLFVGLASGIWSAGRHLVRVIKDRQGEKDP